MKVGPSCNEAFTVLFISTKILFMLNFYNKKFSFSEFFDVSVDVTIWTKGFGLCTAYLRLP